jgi:hypothetical protein
MEGKQHCLEEMIIHRLQKEEMVRPQCAKKIYQCAKKINNDIYE